jgi:glyoxylase I family protein
MLAVTTLRSGGAGMPELAGVAHVVLSVRDLERSRQWYSEVLGFELFERMEDEAYRGTVLVHPTGTVLSLQAHVANTGELFEPHRTGLDHLALKVVDRAELDNWEAHLTALGVTHSPIADMPYGSVLCFRDPDGIQLELFYREGH